MHFFFFFSSRRRHTRLTCDWSSDVCSSDLERFRYQATKARQVQSRVKMLAKIERLELPGASRRIHFKFPEPPRTGRRVATLTGVHKAYGDNVVYAGVDFAVERGGRVALVGENGAGNL